MKTFLSVFGWIILAISVLVAVNSFSYMRRISSFAWILLVIWIVIRFVIKGMSSKTS
jgi:hypothetical protein